MNVQLHKASRSELQALLPWVQAFHAHHQITPPSAGLEAAVRTLISDESLGHIFIIEVDQEPVGYIAVCYGYSIEFGGRDAFIDEFYIDAARRGQGVGRETLKQALVELDAANVQALHLEVAHDNQQAERLYGALGFEKRENYRLMTRLRGDGNPS